MHYDFSQTIGERGLFKEVRTEFQGAEILMVGVSYPHQIKHGPISILDVDVSAELVC